MSVESDKNTKPDNPGEDAPHKSDASVVLNQLRGEASRENTNENPPAKENNAEYISPRSVISPRDDIPPDADEIRQKLADEDADNKIREQLLNAKVWEEKQQMIEKERARQRQEIEREIEADTRKQSARRWKRNGGIGAAVIIIIIILAAFTFSVQPNLQATATSFPYESSYHVLVPQAEPVDFAGIPVTVSGTGDKVIVSIRGGLGTEIGTGDTITLSSPKRMVIRIFGITLFESDYQIVATFLGYVPETSQNEFAVAVMTTRPVPEWAVGAIMPDEVDVTPVSGELL